MSEPAPAATLAPPARVRVWDAPTRIAHWLIVLLVAAAWWTEAHDEMAQHLMAGYALAGVLVFRLLWGFVGGSTARFAGFVRGPRTVFRYAAKLVRPGERAAVVIGHNPMGGWSVVALLALMVGLVGTGLLTSDTDGVSPGPLASRVSYDASDAAGHWHAVLFNGLLVLIGLHLLAVAFYLLVRRDNLVGPMVHGRKSTPAPEAELRPAKAWALALALVIGVATAVLLGRL